MIGVARRLFSSSTATAGAPITHFIFGANTDIGKTVLTAALIRASCEANCSSSSGSGSGSDTHYIKPLQCGGSDESFIRKNAPNLSSSKTLFDWDTPASPHIAARIENKPVSDEEVLMSLDNHLQILGNTPAVAASEIQVSTSNPSSIWIETAGGVLSPSSSSPRNRAEHHARNNHSRGGDWGWVTQADLYKAFRDRSSIVLIGDGRLGGISATLASLEAVLHRNYNVGGIMMLRDDNSPSVDTNVEALKEYVASYRSSSSLSSPDSDAIRSVTNSGLFSDPEKSIISLPKLPPEPEPLDEWYASSDVKDPISLFVHSHLFPSYDIGMNHQND